MTTIYVFVYNPEDAACAACQRIAYATTTDHARRAEAAVTETATLGVPGLERPERRPDGASLVYVDRLVGCGNDVIGGTALTYLRSEDWLLLATDAAGRVFVRSTELWTAWLTVPQYALDKSANSVHDFMLPVAVRRRLFDSVAGWRHAYTAPSLATISRAG